MTDGSEESGYQVCRALSAKFLLIKHTVLSPPDFLIFCSVCRTRPAAEPSLPTRSCCKSTLDQETEFGWKIHAPKGRRKLGQDPLHPIMLKWSESDPQGPTDAYSVTGWASATVVNMRESEQAGAPLAFKGSLRQALITGESICLEHLRTIWLTKWWPTQ